MKRMMYYCITISQRKRPPSGLPSRFAHERVGTSRKDFVTSSYHKLHDGHRDLIFWSIKSTNQLINFPMCVTWPGFLKGTNPTMTCISNGGNVASKGHQKAWKFGALPLNGLAIFLSSAIQPSSNHPQRNFIHPNDHVKSLLPSSLSSSSFSSSSSSFSSRCRCRRLCLLLCRCRRPTSLSSSSSSSSSLIIRSWYRNNPPPLAWFQVTSFWVRNSRDWMWRRCSQGMMFFPNETRCWQKSTHFSTWRWRHIMKTHFEDMWRHIVWRHIVWWRRIFLWRHILALHCLAPHCLVTPHFPVAPHFGAALFGATLLGDATLSCDATFWRHVVWWRHIFLWRHILAPHCLVTPHWGVLRCIGGLEVGWNGLGLGWGLVVWAKMHPVRGVFLGAW